MGDQPRPGQQPGVRNTVSTADVVAQAGVVHGGLHVHSPASDPVVPRQLPAAPPGFAGRVLELAWLDAVLREPECGTTVISAVGGAGGIGKTSLALHWAHLHAERFPDGQLFVDLRGFSPDSAPMPTAVAVRGLLDALGVAPGRLPADQHAQAALFRSLVAGRRMLLVLDNAADTEQVVPLLPGDPSCAVLVTSRNRLTGLIARNGVRHLTLDTLAPAEARAVLAGRLGAARTAAEPDAVDALVGLCGGLALALSIVAARAHSRPDRLADLVGELRELGLDALDDGDPAASLPTALSWSRRSLSAEQVTLFGLLGIAPGLDISPEAAASLVGLPLARVKALLRVLEDMSLLIRTATGRYGMHDLIRAYAARTCAATSEEKAAALRRVTDFYLHTALAGKQLLSPRIGTLEAPDPEPGGTPWALRDQAEALAWFDAEHHCLLAAQHVAAALGWHETVWRLAWAVDTFHLRRAHFKDNLAMWRTAVGATDRLADPAVSVTTHRFLGGALSRLQRHDEALHHLHHALRRAEDIGDRTCQARAHQSLIRGWERAGDHWRALEHADRAVELYRTVDDPTSQADALNSLGWSLAAVGRHEEGRVYCEQALTLHRRLHYPDGEASTLDSLGYIDHHTGHHARSVDRYRQALALRQALDDAWEVAIVLDGLGHPLVSLGHVEQARAVWQEALGIYREIRREEDAERVRLLLDGMRAVPPKENGPRSAG